MAGSHDFDSQDHVGRAVDTDFVEDADATVTAPDVPTPTLVPPAPPAAADVFGPALDGARTFVPGIVLAMVRPELGVTLLEPMERRCRFLSECVDALGLPNASVLRGRAEDATLRADVATARAVAPLDRLAELAVGVVRPGGLVLAIKGQTAAGELRKARPVLRRIGARGAEVVRAGQGKVDPATTVVRFFAR